MCASCIAQGSVYVGGALVTLRVMAARSTPKRNRAPLEAAGADDTSADLPDHRAEAQLPL